VKRLYAAVLTILVALAITSAPAQAVLSVPQIPFASAGLQSRLNGLGESINVLTQQQDGLVWGSSVSGNTTLTIQFDLAGNIGDSDMGIAKLNATGNLVTGLAVVFPNVADNGWFAVASFHPGGVTGALTVNLFNQNAQLVGTMNYTGVNSSLFAYYLRTGGNTFYSHDGFNVDGKTHALAYAGTGQNAGCWWQAWENSVITNYGDADFNDALVFMESLNPTPVSHTTWGKVKARFR
jgi:hypothetical protein